MADTAEKLTTKRVAKVPLSDRNSQPMMRNMVRYMSGTRGSEIFPGSFREGIVEHGKTGKVDRYVRVGGANVRRQPSGMGSHVGNLGYFFLGQLQGDVNARDVAGGGYKAIDQKRFLQGNALDAFQDVGWLCEGIGDEIGNEEVVSLDSGMLEIRHRINARGIRDLPRLARQVLHCRERRPGKDVALAGRQDEEDVVVFAVDVLQVVKGIELRDCPH